MRDFFKLGLIECASKSQGVHSSICFFTTSIGNSEIKLNGKIEFFFCVLAKFSSGVSLNDFLLVGPRILQDLFSIHLRFRILPIVLIADID